MDSRSPRDGRVIEELGTYDPRVTTSGRRWETHGVCRTILKMWGLRLAAWGGVSPVRLARLYGYGAAAQACEQRGLPHA